MFRSNQEAHIFIRVRERRVHVFSGRTPLTILDSDTFREDYFIFESRDRRTIQRESFGDIRCQSGAILRREALRKNNVFGLDSGRRLSQPQNGKVHAIVDYSVSHSRFQRIQHASRREGAIATRNGRLAAPFRLPSILSRHVSSNRARSSIHAWNHVRPAPGRRTSREEIHNQILILTFRRQ